MLGKPNFSSEFYVIEKTIEFVAKTNGGEQNTYRIEALKDEKGRYSTRCYVQDHIAVQPAYPVHNGKYQRPVDTFEIWKSIDVGWTDRDTADEAISQALEFMRPQFGSREEPANGAS